MATLINADTSDGLKLTSDTSGEIEFQSAGVTKASVTSAGFTVGGSNISPQPTFRNRIINGNMAIDQRNAGASITPINGQYGVDKWRNGLSAASKFSVQKTPSTTETGYETRVGAGFINYLAATSLSAYSVGASEVFLVSQYVEGYNMADLVWGTANAKTVTLSFWVRSSLTGTFGGAFQNLDRNRCFPFSYTISVANTWEQKTITVAGDTSGTWETTNGLGVQIHFSLGVGSTYNGAAGAWAGASHYSATGATSVVGTSGATWYITGVQLEVGEQASDFENLQYGTQLALCQRYYQKSYAQGTVPGANVTSSFNEAVVFGGWGSENVAKLFTAEHKIPLRPGTQSLSFWDMAGNASTLSSFDNGFTRTDNRSPTGGNAISENRHYVAPGTSTYNAYAWAYAISSEL